MVAEHVFQWRNMMEFFLIKHFRRCLPLLLKYDAVGEPIQTLTPTALHIKRTLSYPAVTMIQPTANSCLEIFKSPCCSVTIMFFSPCMLVHLSGICIGYV